MKWIDVARARLRLLFARRATEERMREEFRFHVDMETDRLVREEGLAPEEARRRALVAFGGMDRHGEAMRDGRGLGWVSGLSLDLRLGLRMLVKYPGLTIVGGFGMAVAIAVAGVSFGLLSAMLDPSLPVPQGDRVVAVQHINARTGNSTGYTRLHDLETWREQLRSVGELGAFREVNRNLVVGDGAELITLAEISASGFALVRARPLLGRPLLTADEEPEAPPVIVIGEDEWRQQFAADPRIIGRSLRLGSTHHTVVGVMPTGFGFPINHQYWIPLKSLATDFARAAGPAVQVFGRLTADTDMDAAGVEVETIRSRLAVSHPGTYEELRAQVVPYTYPYFDVDAPGVAWIFALVQAMTTLLLVVVGVNVAVLMYARTASRLGEITVRTALGASRRRVVLQLFAEALVLSGVATVIGLMTASLVLNRVAELLRRELGGALPFWLEPGVSPGLAAYAAGLAVLAAVIVGVVPALRATGSRIQSGLKNLGTGAAGMQLGRTWTLLIIAQVAIAVAILPMAMHNTLRSARFGLAATGYPEGKFLQAFVGIDRQETPSTGRTAAYEREITAHLAHATAELVERLEADPAVARATVSQDLPGSTNSIRIDAGVRTADASFNRVAPNYFQTFDVPLVAGRQFDVGDASEGSSAVIVNRTFVETVLGGGKAVGQTVRYIARPDEWDEYLRVDRQFDIVGVVADFPQAGIPDGNVARIYRPLAAGHAYPSALARYPTAVMVRMRDNDATAYIRRLRTVAMETSAALVVEEPIAMDEAGHKIKSTMRMIALGVLAVTLSVMLLSAAGIYAMMSFTVARRRREIGIRAALGAAPAQLLGAMFSRAAKQLGIGIVIGLALAAVLDFQLETDYAALLAPVAALMLAVGLLAAVGPARRGLRIQPTEALREN
jgi:putative ABC transport system permease protein